MTKNKDLYNLTIEEQVEIFGKYSDDVKLPVWIGGQVAFYSNVKGIIHHIRNGNATMLPSPEGSWGVKLTAKGYKMINESED